MAPRSWASSAIACKVSVGVSPTAGAGGLDDHGERVGQLECVEQRAIGHHDLDAERGRAGRHHADGLRQRVGGPAAAPGPVLIVRRASVIASATAVASSSRLAPAVGSPVRSATTVWKLSSASSRPWLISGWYGVYAVYQAGASSTLRRITDGVMVPW